MYITDEITFENRFYSDFGQLFLSYNKIKLLSIDLMWLIGLHDVFCGH